jgi:lipopolysaccharide/colanic/teichoic acid biosynthesis glycosyltransferase
MTPTPSRAPFDPAVPLQAGDVLDVAAAPHPAESLTDWLRHVVDRVLAVALCCALSPVLLLTMGLVKLHSPGPVFHRRLVLGRGGVRFYALKFRTMDDNADARLHRDPELRARFELNFKLEHDPRITPLGRWLRKYSVDELPQLFNVVRGEMALVGPRMISPPELSRYGPYGHRLLTVRPGITGLWQVSGRQLTTYDDRVRYDLHYVKHRSIWLDLRILARTLPVVIGARGAY